jgi:hypothetical protein
MSTKIYDAFRISKKNDIGDIITNMRLIATNIIANSVNYLQTLHSMAIVQAIKNKDVDMFAMKAYEEITNNELSTFFEIWMLDLVKKSELSNERNMLDCSLKAVCTFDDKYWYIKFFCNSEISRQMLNAIVLKHNELEDYHYQNQVDPPDNVTEVEYNKRGDKWNELLPNCSPFNIFPFEITIFNHSSFDRLIFDFNSNKIKMAYKFDKKYEGINI